MDFETETFIAHSLSADGFDASEDGTGRGVPMIPIAICTAHTQSNGSGFSDGVAHTLESVPSQVVAFNLRGRDGGALPEVSDAASLRAASGGSSNSYVAFSAKDSGADVSDIAPTLRSMNNRGGNPNGGGQVAIAFTLPGSDGTVSTATPTDVAGSVRTKAPGSIENSSTTAVLQEQPVAWSGELTASTDTAGTLQRGGEGAHCHQHPSSRGRHGQRHSGSA
jgi:DNA (cytosine-5)-methyltransferase 1